MVVVVRRRIGVAAPGKVRVKVLLRQGTETTP